MGIREVIVPQVPSGFSAWGMLSADIVNDFAQTDLRVLDEIDPSALESQFQEMEAAALDSLADQGIGPEQATTERQLELRYLGQEHGLLLTVGQPLDLTKIASAFAELHELRYGHVMDAPVQILNVRTRGIGMSGKPTMKVLASCKGDSARAMIGTRPAFCFAVRAMVDFTIYDRGGLAPGDRIAGPAMIDEGTSVTVLHSDQRLTVDDYGHLLISTAGEEG
jgi:N-methylhydantoinase A